VRLASVSRAGSAAQDLSRMLPKHEGERADKWTAPVKERRGKPTAGFWGGLDGERGMA
jgi:hypothetical protein